MRSQERPQDGERQSQDHDVDRIDGLEGAGRYLVTSVARPIPTLSFATFQSISNAGFAMFFSEFRQNIQCKHLIAIMIAELLLGRLEFDGPAISEAMSVRSTARSNTRLTFRSVKILMELPACSKNAQNNMQKNVRMRTTPMRCRATVSIWNVS